MLILSRKLFQISSLNINLGFIITQKIHHPHTPRVLIKLVDQFCFNDSNIFSLLRLYFNVAALPAIHFLNYVTMLNSKIWILLWKFKDSTNYSNIFFFSSSDFCRQLVASLFHLQYWETFQKNRRRETSNKED